MIHVRCLSLIWAARFVSFFLSFSFFAIVCVRRWIRAAAQRGRRGTTYNLLFKRHLLLFAYCSALFCQYEWSVLLLLFVGGASTLFLSVWSKLLPSRQPKIRFLPTTQAWVSGSKVYLLCRASFMASSRSSLSFLLLWWPSMSLGSTITEISSRSALTWERE